jgi:hypothetical protein
MTHMKKAIIFVLILCVICYFDFQAYLISRDVGYRPGYVIIPLGGFVALFNAPEYMKRDAIRNHAAHYDTETNKFTWGEK